MDFSTASKTRNNKAIFAQMRSIRYYSFDNYNSNDSKKNNNKKIERYTKFFLYARNFSN